MATTFDIPLLNNSEEHVSLPLGKDILEDVDPIIQLLTKERVSLPLWVALGAEYYLAGLKNQAEQIFVAADKARQMIEEMQEGVGEEALAIALGTFYSIEAQLAADKDDEAESLRLRTLSTKYLDMENRDQETELPWLGSGVDLLRKNKIRDAKSRFTAALDLTENKSMYAMLGMAACSFIEGNYELSRNNYANCITLHKNCPPAVRVGLGHCFYMLNNHEYARKAFERARVLDPNNAQAAVGLAILKMNESTDAADLENVKLSMKLLREAYMDDQANPMALNHLANHFFWRGEMDRVKGFCRRSFETTTHNGMRAEALLLLARAHHKSGDVSKAKQFYKESETKYKEHAKVFGGNKQSKKIPVLLSVGLAQMDLIDNNIKGAVERFSEALSRAPDNKELVLVLGALHKKYKKLLSRKIDKNSGKFKLSTRMVKDNSLRALKYLKQATDLDATNADAQIEMAEMKQAVGTDQHYRTALKHYMKAERSKVTAGDDVAPQIHINQGVLHFQLGEYEKAMQAYERAFAEEDDSSHSSSSSSSAAASSSSSSSSSAIDDTTPLKTIFNKFSSIMYDAKNITMTYNFARLCESMKDYDLAKEIYSTLSSKYPMYVESFLRLADIAYTLEKDVDSALEYIFDALCINPENASALSMQGNMYLRKGEVGKAQVSFEALVQLKSKSKRTGDSYALLSLANIEFGRSEKLRMKGGLLSTKAKSHLENAQRIYERCLTSDIKNTYAANGLGIVMAELGHAKAATDIFSKINEQSSMLHSRINLAHMYMSNEEVNQSREAVKLYEICVEQCDKNDVELHSEYLMYLARAYARSEQFEKALTILEQCKELNPNDSNIWFNIASTQTRYANHSLEKARSDARFLKVKVVQKSIDLLKSSRALFQKAHDVAKEAEDRGDKTGSILYDTKTAIEYMQSISKEGEGGEDDDWLTTAGAYLDAAKIQEGKNQETREQTLQQLKEEEKRQQMENERKVQREKEELEEREKRAKEITAKAAEQNVQAAKEAKLHKERRKQARARPKRKRDSSEILGEESRSEDTESSSSSDSDSDSEDEMELSSKAPLKKKAKLSATAAAIFSDSDDSDDDMISSGAADKKDVPAASSKGLLEDSDEDD